MDNMDIDIDIKLESESEVEDTPGQHICEECGVNIRMIMCCSLFII